MKSACEKRRAVMAGRNIGTRCAYAAYKGYLEHEICLARVSK